MVSTVSRLSGQVKLSNGDVWTARTRGGELPPATSVTVAAIDGATAVVTPTEGAITSESEAPLENRRKRDRSDRSTSPR